MKACSHETQCLWPHWEKQSDVWFRCGHSIRAMVCAVDDTCAVDNVVVDVFAAPIRVTKISTERWKSTSSSYKKSFISWLSWYYVCFFQSSMRVVRLRVSDSNRYYHLFPQDRSIPVEWENCWAIYIEWYSSRNWTSRWAWHRYGLCQEFSRDSRRGISDSSKI